MSTELPLYDNDYEYESKPGDDLSKVYKEFCVKPKTVSISCQNWSCTNVNRKYGGAYHDHYVSLPKIIKMLNNNEFADEINIQVEGSIYAWYEPDGRPTAYTMSRLGKILKSTPYHVKTMHGCNFTIERDRTN